MDLCALRIPLRGTSLRLSCALRAGRPKKSAHEAIDAIADAMYQGQTQVIDADLSKYFDSIPHAKLMATVAERIVDGAVLALIKQWLKAPVMGDSENGKTACVGGGKGNSRGTLAVWSHITAAIKHLPAPDGSYLATPRTGTEIASEVSAIR